GSCPPWQGAQERLSILLHHNSQRHPESFALTAPASESVPPGGTNKLSCTRSRYSIGSYRVEWYQQKLGSAPRFVYHYQTSSDQGRGTGIPARFTVSPDSSNNLWNLVISGVQAEDEADYYCAVWDGSSYVHHSDTVR
uniref:Ig-like domain-containing protein n=1 Tax=Chrysemys picta bellii TaxID=8478 RepID=A0A8C3FDX5_CHRPI